MTSSPSSSQQAPDNKPKGGRWRRLVPRQIKEEIKRIIQEEVKRSLVDMQAEKKVQEALDKFDIDKKLDIIVNQFTEKTIKSKEEFLQHFLDSKLEDFTKIIQENKDLAIRKIKRESKNLNDRISRATKDQLITLKTWKDAESDLKKTRYVIAVVPIAAVILSLFFNVNGIVSDVNSIDTLRTQIEHLKKDSHAPHPSQEPAACLPGDEACCSLEDGFFSC